MKETIKTLPEGGVIEEMAEAIREASAAARDTANEIKETVKNLRESGIIGDTAGAIEETRNIAQDTIQTLRKTTSDAADAAPETTEAIRKGAETIRHKLGSVYPPPPK
jgi:DNA-binding ferritin-like protein